MSGESRFLRRLNREMEIGETEDTTLLESIRIDKALADQYGWIWEIQ